MQRMTLAGGLASVGTAESRQNRTVTYRIKGFSCVTCAVGLETMLRQQKGIARATASYPHAQVTIEFNPEAVTDAWLRAFIGDMGFVVAKRKEASIF
jgi:copper chaperone CopZ